MRYFGQDLMTYLLSRSSVAQLVNRAQCDSSAHEKCTGKRRGPVELRPRQEQAGRALSLQPSVQSDVINRLFGPVTLGRKYTIERASPS